MPERPPQRLPEGEFIGTLQWQDMSGAVRRWKVRQGKRVDQIRVEGMKDDHGWDFVLAKLRGHLARKRLCYPVPMPVPGSSGDAMEDAMPGMSGMSGMMVGAVKES